MLGSLLKAYIAGPEHPAKYRLVRWLGRRLMPERGVVGDVYPRAKLWLNPTDLVEYLLLRNQSYEPLTLDFLGANLRPGDHAIFAGVNNGLHAIVGARAVGSTGRVIACDPQPLALLKARANMALNEIPEGSLTPVAVALGSTATFTPMPWPPADNSGAASFYAAGGGFVAPVVELAEVARALSIGPTRLFLLDVQGYEYQVLAGIGDTLRPEIIVVEDEAEFSVKAGVARASLHQRLLDMGYSLHNVYGEPVEATGPFPPELNLYGVLPQVSVRWAQRGA